MFSLDIRNSKNSNFFIILIHHKCIAERLFSSISSFFANSDVHSISNSYFRISRSLTMDKSYIKWPVIVEYPRSTWPAITTVIRVVLMDGYEWMILSSATQMVQSGSLVTNHENSSILLLSIGEWGDFFGLFSATGVRGLFSVTGVEARGLFSTLTEGDRGLFSGVGDKWISGIYNSKHQSSLTIIDRCFSVFTFPSACFCFTISSGDGVLKANRDCSVFNPIIHLLLGSKSSSTVKMFFWRETGRICVWGVDFPITDANVSEIQLTTHKNHFEEPNMRHEEQC